MPAQDSVIVITGGSSGIGLALARELLVKGAKGVVITGRSKEKLDKVSGELGTEFGQDKILAVSCDATSWDDNVSLMKTANEKYGRIDYVFANATGQENAAPFSLFAKPDYMSAASMVSAVSYTTHAALPYLVSSDSNPVTAYAGKPASGPGRDRGVFITGSEAGFNGFTPSPTYAASKAAMAGMVWALRERLQQVGVRVDLIAPGWIDTPMVTNFKKMGVVHDEDCIPMKTIIDALVRFVEDTSLTGIVTRVPSHDVKPFDVGAATLPSVTWERWGGIVEHVEKASSA